MRTKRESPEHSPEVSAAFGILGWNWAGGFDVREVLRKIRLGLSFA